jgi:hypothetical protein
MPVVAVDGVSPVVPAEKLVTGVVITEEASSVTTLELFLKYSFPSLVLRANSPATKSAANGAARAVVL